MARILMTNISAEGHVNPTIGLVESLVQRGNQVTYYCTETFAERLRHAGAEVRIYEDFLRKMMEGAGGPLGPGAGGSAAAAPGMQPEKVGTRLAAAQAETAAGAEAGAAAAEAPAQPIGPPGAAGGEPNVLLMLNGLLQAATEQMAIILPEVRQEEYDYVIYDSMFSPGWMMAEVLGLPKVCSSSTFAIPEGGTQELKQLQIDKNSELYRNLLEKIRLLEEQYALDLSCLHEVQHHFFHPGDLNLVFTSREFQVYADRFAEETFRFVGPSITKRLQTEPFPIEEIEGDQPVLFISLGTVFNQQREFFIKCIEAFRDFDGKVVMSIGRKVTLEELPPLPEQFIVRPYVPQLEVLQHADVFFTHGGMNSTSEALYYGTPLAVLPVSADQPMVAGRVAELGAGLRLDLSSVTPQELREAAQTLLTTPSYRERAAAIGESFRAAGGAARAAELLEEWIAARKEQSLPQ